MKTPVIISAALSLLFYISASQAFSIKSRNEGGLGTGDESRITPGSDANDALSQSMNIENLMPIKERTGNYLHEIRKREALDGEQSYESNEGELEDDAEAQKEEEQYKRGLFQKIKDFLRPIKDTIGKIMKPVIDRIKHKPKRPKPDHVPAAVLAPDSDSSSSATTSDDGHDDYAIIPTLGPPPAVPPLSKCAKNERHRNMETLSLLFPELAQNREANPFVFLPLTDTLIRVIEQKIIQESRGEGIDSEIEI